MHKIVKRISGLAAALILLICLSSCQKDTAPETIAGEYELSSLRYAEDSSEAADSSGLSGKLILNEDGTGTLNLFGNDMAVTFDEQTKTIQTAQAEAVYTVSNNTLEFSLDGSFICVFAKVN